MAHPGARLGQSILEGLLGRQRPVCALGASTVTGRGTGRRGHVLPLGELCEFGTQRPAVVTALLPVVIAAGLHVT